MFLNITKCNLLKNFRLFVHRYEEKLNLMFQKATYIDPEKINICDTDNIWNKINIRKLNKFKDDSQIHRNENLLQVNKERNIECISKPCLNDSYSQHTIENKNPCNNNANTSIHGTSCKNQKVSNTNLFDKILDARIADDKKIFVLFLDYKNEEHFKNTSWKVLSVVSMIFFTN